MYFCMLLKKIDNSYGSIRLGSAVYIHCERVKSLTLGSVPVQQLQHVLMIHQLPHNRYFTLHLLSTDT